MDRQPLQANLTKRQNNKNKELVSEITLQIPALPQSTTQHRRLDFIKTCIKMHFSILSFASILTVATSQVLQVNYYSSGGCQGYLASFKPPISGGAGTCVDYEIAGSNSANIADCTYGNSKCLCYFYTLRGCKGRAKGAGFQNQNCASNWGSRFQSVKCIVSKNG